MWRSWFPLLALGACTLPDTPPDVPDPDPDPPPILPSCDGAFDATFGTAGILRASNQVPLMEPLAAVMQPDDKLVVVGRAFVDGDRFVIVRYLPDGTLDPSLGNGGLAIPEVGDNARARAVALDASGKLVIAGTIGTNAVVARFTAAGELDTSFAGGIVTLGEGVPYAVAVTPAGIVVAADAGLARARLFRRDATGAADPTFGIDGVTLIGMSQPLPESAVGGFAVDTKGRHLLAALEGNFHEPITARVDELGELDTTFGVDGRAFPGESGAAGALVVEQIPGRAVVVIDRSTAFQKIPTTVLFGHIEFGPSGSECADPAFGQGGASRLPRGIVGKAVAKGIDDTISVGGDNEGFWVAARTTANGTFDTCWASDTAIGTSRILATDSLGRIVMVGAAPEDDGTDRTRLVLARLAP